MRKKRDVMSMNLTRRDAVKGIAAVSIVPLFPSCAFAASADRGDVATTNFEMAGTFYPETLRVPTSRGLTPQRGHGRPASRLVDRRSSESVRDPRI
jgi:hypothetical protein